MSEDDKDSPPPPPSQSKDRRKEGGDIEKVTDYVEQSEMDSDKASQAIAAIVDEQSIEQKNMELLREKELAAVKIDSAHVVTIAKEMELDTKDAERALREHRGDLVATLNALVAAE